MIKKKLYVAFMNLEKAHYRDDRGNYGAGGQFFDGMKAFYREASAGGREEGELSKSVPMRVGVKQGCLVPPRLFNIFMNGCTTEIEAKVENAAPRLRLKGVARSVAACLF